MSQIDTNDSFSIDDIMKDVKSEWKKISMSFCAFMDRTNNILMDKESIIRSDIYAVSYFCHDTDSKMDEFVMLFNDICKCSEIKEGHQSIVKEITEYVKKLDEVTLKIMNFIDYYHKDGRIYNPNYNKD